MDINTVTLTGRLGGDIDLRYTATGTAVANVNLAVESGFGDKKKTHWFGLDFWGKAAESAKEYLAKGRKIAISGRLDHSEYEKDGKTVSKTRVVVEQWTFADGERRTGGDGQRSEQPRQRAEAPARRQETPPARRAEPQRELPIGGGDDDDDIPFASFEKHSPLPL